MDGRMDGQKGWRDARVKGWTDGRRDGEMDG